MILTKHSQELTTFFIENNCINHERINPKTREILFLLYNQIKTTENHTQHTRFTKQIHNLSLSHPSIKPRSFDLRSFPESIIKHIDSTASIEVTYTFSLQERNIVVHFILENSNEVSNCDKHLKLIIHLNN